MYLSLFHSNVSSSLVIHQSFFILIFYRCEHLKWFVCRAHYKCMPHSFAVRTARKVAVARRTRFLTLTSYFEQGHSSKWKAIVHVQRSDKQLVIVKYEHNVPMCYGDQLKTTGFTSFIEGKNRVQITNPRHQLKKIHVCCCIQIFYKIGKGQRQLKKHAVAFFLI